MIHAASRERLQLLGYVSNSTVHNAGKPFTHKEVYMTTKATSTKPAYRLRYGNVAAAIWPNNSPSGYFYHTTFERVYKQGDRWAESFSFDDRDLPSLAKAALDIHSWIQQQKANAVTVKGDESS
jgi:hypothetical protein